MNNILFNIRFSIKYNKIYDKCIKNNIYYDLQEFVKKYYQPYYKITLLDRLLYDLSIIYKNSFVSLNNNPFMKEISNNNDTTNLPFNEQTKLY